MRIEAEYTKARKTAKTGKPGDGKKEMIYSEFHSLLSSGLDLNRSFKLLIKGEKEDPTRYLLEKLHAEVVGGAPLWKVFTASGAFSQLECGVIRIGEETGRLGESLVFLADYYHMKIAQKRMISSAVSYPAIILATAVAVLVFMMAVVVPMFEQVYSRMGGDLPGITRAVISFSSGFKSYGAAVVSLIAAGGVAAWRWRNHDAFRRIRARAAMKLPLAGDLLRKYYQSHFCKLMYLLYSSGVPLLKGVEMMREVITFYPYRSSFFSVAEGIRRGESFSSNMARFPDIYDQKLLILLRVGEETNRLSDMLRKQGDDLSTELEYRLKQLGGMLEPLLIIFVGVLVALVLVSMYLPMFKLGTTIY